MKIRNYENKVKEYAKSIKLVMYYGYKIKKHAYLWFRFYLIICSF